MEKGMSYIKINQAGFVDVMDDNGIVVAEFDQFHAASVLLAERAKLDAMLKPVNETIKYTLGDLISSIKLYRDNYKVSLKEAKAAVEVIRENFKRHS